MKVHIEGCGCLLIILALVAVPMYVALHFLIKFW